MKLFRVNLTGLNNITGVNLQSSYVIAEDANLAYEKVRKYLDEKDYGFRDDRAMESVQLLAEDYEYTETRVRLFL